MSRKAPIVQIGATPKSQKVALDSIMTILGAAVHRGDDVIIKALDVFSRSTVTQNIEISHSTFADHVTMSKDYEPGFMPRKE